MKDLTEQGIEKVLTAMSEKIAGSPEVQQTAIEMLLEPMVERMVEQMLMKAFDVYKKVNAYDHALVRDEIRNQLQEREAKENRLKERMQRLKPGEVSGARAELEFLKEHLRRERAQGLQHDDSEIARCCELQDEVARNEKERLKSSSGHAKAAK